MSFLMSRLGRYIVGRVFGGVLIALVGVLACILLIDLVVFGGFVQRSLRLGQFAALQMGLRLQP